MTSEPQYPSTSTDTTASNADNLESNCERPIETTDEIVEPVGGLRSLPKSTPQLAHADSGDGDHDGNSDHDDDGADQSVSAPGSSHPAVGSGGSARLALVTASTPARQAAVASQLDRLSLEQALLDVEVANARVIDLTSRLVEANQRATALREELDAARGALVASDAQIEAKRTLANEELLAKEAQLAAQQAHLEAQKASTAYRWAAKVWNLRNAIRN
jgi:hypothetical protein